MSINSPIQTLAELLEGLGSVPLERIPCHPSPGQATEQDLLVQPGAEKRLYELVDGVLVEKPLGYYKALLAAWSGTPIRLPEPSASTPAQPSPPCSPTPTS